MSQLYVSLFPLRRNFVLYDPEKRASNVKSALINVKSIQNSASNDISVMQLDFKSSILN